MAVKRGPLIILLTIAHLQVLTTVLLVREYWKNIEGLKDDDLKLRPNIVEAGNDGVVIASSVQRTPGSSPTIPQQTVSQLKHYLNQEEQGADALSRLEDRLSRETTSTFDSEASTSESRTILFQNNAIGTISPLCRPHGDCDLVAPNKVPGDKCPNINGPVVVTWNGTHHLFVGEHVHRSGGPIRLFRSKSTAGPWQEVAELQIPSFPECNDGGIYSPSILEFDGRFYMHAHVHKHSCKGVPKGQRQPTIALVSDDLVHWDFAPNDAADRYVSRDHFYSKLFVYKDVIYAIAKSQEDNIGSMTLMRSESPLGPYKTVSILAKGPRHACIHRKGDILFIFFTLIGDEPERILLGTMDLTEETWTLLPGPVIMNPQEIGPRRPSKMGPAPCEPVQELRDPFFVPDQDEKDDELRGTLFCTLRGEQAIGAATLQINLTEYHNSTRFRDPSLVDDLVFQSSSLVNQTDAKDRPLLITGVGRSGTTFVCNYLNRFGWNISHDNSYDCGPFGGANGASSWVHAFRQKIKEEAGYRFALSVAKVVHLVREPLSTVKSRLSRRKSLPQSVRFLLKMIDGWENLDFLGDGSEFNYHSHHNISSHMYGSLALRHWINRNSFVSQHAAWRVSIEDLSSDPIHTWDLCLEVYRGEPCPNLDTLRTVLQSMNRTINNNGRAKEHDRDSLFWWERLAKVNEDDVRIALKMSNEYGYHVQDVLMERFQVEQVKYACNFENEAAARLGQSEPRNWRCSITHEVRALKEQPETSDHGNEDVKARH